VARPRTLALLTALLALAVVSPARAALGGTTGGTAGPTTLADRAAKMGLTCSPVTSADGVAYTRCTGEIASFDGIGLDTDLSIPTGATAPAPTVVFLHGWSLDKTNWEADSIGGDSAQQWHWNNVWFVSRDWVAINYTARGFEESCGTADADPTCPNGYTHLADRNFETRDTQTILGKLVDAGIANGNRLLSTGESYGGGQSWLLATAMPWKSPKGRTLQLAAAVPLYGWTDLLDSLVPSGRATGGTNQTANHVTPLGVPKDSYISALYVVGRALAQGRYDTDPTHPATNLDLQYADIQSGEPYDSKPNVDVVKQSFRDRGAYYASAYLAAVRAHTVHEVPVFSVQGWTDPLFPPVQALQMFRELKAADPGYPVQMAFGDVGHSNAQNPAPQWTAINTLTNGFVDAYVLGKTSEKPAAQAYSFQTHCPAAGGTATPVSGPWDSLAAGTATASWTGSKATTSADPNPGDGAATDPLANSGCMTEQVSDEDPGQAFWSWTVPAGGLTLLGLPAVQLGYALSGVDATLVFKLWDVAPDGTKTLVTRGDRRIATEAGDPATGTLATELWGNHWAFPAGDTIELQVGQTDSPTFRPDNLPSSLALSSLSLTLPTREPGAVALTPSA
jgi:predicted acyl esterase